ncbi:unnamed protein product [Trichogramma brassicae]|uniref:Uncharacterized protein n=1 Tax=Trichogramma brassicae TaxID=86971 RepID=A0A6H5IJJ1_9HYME|nr:unnamed protein product [Trichogramma brassicae]
MQQAHNSAGRHHKTERRARSCRSPRMSLSLDGNHLQSSVSHLQAAQIHQQMQSQQQSQLHQPQQQAQTHHQIQNHQTSQNISQGNQNSVRDNKSKEQESNNAQVLSRIQHQQSQNIQQNLMHHQQVNVSIGTAMTSDVMSTSGVEKTEKKDDIRQLNMTQFQVPDLKAGSHMMDVRTADGSIVKITTASDQDIAKTLGVDITQYINKVNNINFLFT